MTKKLNSMPDYTAHLPKHPHDVSQSFAFTSCPGMLLPVYYDALHLGDELHFSASEFVRLNPLEQQPLGEIDVHLDYFFVPLTVMYLPSSSLFYETDDLVSSVFAGGNVNTDGFPVMDFKTTLTSIAASGGTWGYASPMYGIGSSGVKFPSNNFDTFGKSIYRLMDCLDMSPDLLINAIQGDTLTFVPAYTPWFALAYQAIYQLYFRNDDREPKNYHYNIDQYANVGTAFSETLDGTYKSILQINYASRPKDYFYSVKVSPIANSVSMLNQSSLQGLYGQVNNWINSNVYTASSNTNTLSNLNSGATQVKANSTYINTGTIRQMFMVEKLLRVVGRAEKNYESQFLAHYGIKIPHDVMHNITHIGHDMMTIKPEAVISQANTFNASTNEGSALGEIGGKGSGMLSGRKRSFTAPFHGIFMAISHIVPRKRYVLGLNKLHQLNKVTDFWQPEFDQKGMQPLFYYECGLDVSTNQSMITRVGWQYAYEQFKRKADKVSRAFVPGRWNYQVNTYAPWVLSQFAYGLPNNNGTQDVYYGISRQAYDFLVSPNDLNVNMQVPHNTAWVPEASSASESPKPWLLYQTDPFICDFNMYCKKVNRMSEYGEPEL